MERWLLTDADEILRYSSCHQDIAQFMLFNPHNPVFLSPAIPFTFSSRYAFFKSGSFQFSQNRSGMVAHGLEVMLHATLFHTGRSLKNFGRFASSAPMVWVAGLLDARFLAPVMLSLLFRTRSHRSWYGTRVIAPRHRRSRSLLDRKSRLHWMDGKISNVMLPTYVPTRRLALSCGKNVQKPQPHTETEVSASCFLSSQQTDLT